MSVPPSGNTVSSTLPSALVWIMTVATGLAVAGNYYAQPLLPLIAGEFRIPPVSAGVIVTSAQLGYAFGLLFIVPLGDLYERRRLIVGMTLLTACGLLISALAPNILVLLVGTVLAGLFSVVAQVLLPFAATLASPEKRGRVVGTVMSGLLAGILLARTAAGLASGLAGWRTVYWCGAGAMLIVALVLARGLPRHHESAGLGYPQLLLSILGLFRDEPVLRLRAFLGAMSFASFSVLWTSMAFLLAAPPYGFSAAAIGLFGLAGAAGVLAASAVGHLSDRGRGALVTGLGLLLLSASWLLLAGAPHSLAVMVAGILVLDFAAAGVHVSNQGAIYRLRPEARNRLTAAYMTCYFIGGAGGSLLSATAYGRAGWPGVMAVGAACSLSGLIVWLLAGGDGKSGAKEKS